MSAARFNVSAKSLVVHIVPDLVIPTTQNKGLESIEVTVPLAYHTLVVPLATILVEMPPVLLCAVNDLPLESDVI